MKFTDFRRDIMIKTYPYGIILLIGISGSGKSTFAKRLFLETEIISTDRFRALVSDDEASMGASGSAFKLAYQLVEERLKMKKLCVFDATNLNEQAWNPLKKIAKDYFAPISAIILDVPLQSAIAQNDARDRVVAHDVILAQYKAFKRVSFEELKKHGIKKVYKLNQEDMKTVQLERQNVPSVKDSVTGPFDIIGDIHGCAEQFHELVIKLGGKVEKADLLGRQIDRIIAPEGRTLVSVGDLVDRGPDSIGVLLSVLDACARGQMYLVPGNHDDKVKRYLQGHKVSRNHGTGETLEALDKENDQIKAYIKDGLNSLSSHLVFDYGRLVVAHAGLPKVMHGRMGPDVLQHALYGETTGKYDPDGLPQRIDWAGVYKSKAFVVYGHVPSKDVQIRNNTACVDTGCCFGAKLSALRYPEMTVVSVDSETSYRPLKRDLVVWPVEEKAPKKEEVFLKDNRLDLNDLIEKREVVTNEGTVKYSYTQSVSALESMERVASNPRRLIYLPPTMAPVRPSDFDDYLEHPHEAFSYFLEKGVKSVMCQTKHMGSRANMLVVRDPKTAKDIFGDENTFSVWTRNGRKFFNDEMSEKIGKIVRKAMDWKEYTWVLLDAEIMPWSAKAHSLIKDQYLNTSGAGSVGLPVLINQLKKASKIFPEMGAILEKQKLRLENVNKFSDVVLNYCWEQNDLEGLKIAPFHVLASSKETYFHKDHGWHMEQILKMTQKNDLLCMTDYKIVDLMDVNSVEDATKWWIQNTENLHEGMVVKPFGFTEMFEGKMVQPALKVRGREYLRIIYGPDYLMPENLSRLKDRGGAKYSRALKEYSLGKTALDHFVKNDPLHLTHKAVFAIMALESEGIDPRL